MPSRPTFAQIGLYAMVIRTIQLPVVRDALATNHCPYWPLCHMITAHPRCLAILALCHMIHMIPGLCPCWTLCRDNWWSRPFVAYDDRWPRPFAHDCDVSQYWPLCLDYWRSAMLARPTSCPDWHLCHTWWSSSLARTTLFPWRPLPTMMTGGGSNLFVHDDDWWWCP